MDIKTRIKMLEQAVTARRTRTKIVNHKKMRALVQVINCHPDGRRMVDLLRRSYMGPATFKPADCQEDPQSLRRAFYDWARKTFPEFAELIA